MVRYNKLFVKILRLNIFSQISIFGKRRINLKLNLLQKNLFFSFSYIIKMDIENNNIEKSINSTEEENPATFEKLKNLLDEKQVKYKLLEVIQLK